MELKDENEEFVSNLFKENEMLHPNFNVYKNQQIVYKWIQHIIVIMFAKQNKLQMKRKKLNNSICR